ncbi:MAG: type II toxin-antitoxin system VapC family toxin [Gemmatimonadales bacterium]
MIVADANLIAYLIMPGERTEEAEAVLSKDAMWAAPILWRSELRSVVHKYVVRRDITIARALGVLEQADQVIDGRESHVESSAVLELASRSKCSTYDCEYVALAVALGVPLITTDRAILRAFPMTARTPAAFLEA